MPQPTKRQELEQAGQLRIPGAPLLSKLTLKGKAFREAVRRSLAEDERFFGERRKETDGGAHAPTISNGSL
jgi:hypothetical protein